MGIGPAARASACSKSMSRGSSRTGAIWRGRSLRPVARRWSRPMATRIGASVVAGSLAAAGCRRFFVATLDEALALRETLARAKRNCGAERPGAGFGARNSPRPPRPGAE